MSNNRREKIQALLDAGRLESVPFDTRIFAEQLKSCSLFRIDAIFLLENNSAHGAFSVAYTYMRKSATLLLTLREVRSRGQLILEQTLFTFGVSGQFVFVAALNLRSMNVDKMSVAMTRPISCMTINIGTDSRAMPANDSLKLRAMDTAGLANDVDEVNQ